MPRRSTVWEDRSGFSSRMPSGRLGRAKRRELTPELFDETRQGGALRDLALDGLSGLSCDGGREAGRLARYRRALKLHQRLELRLVELACVYPGGDLLEA